MDSLEADLSEGLHGVQISVDLTIDREDVRGGGGLLQWRQLPTTVSSSSSILLLLLPEVALSQPGLGHSSLVETGPHCPRPLIILSADGAAI